MEEIRFSNDQQHMCPKCGAPLCQQWLEYGSNFHLFCEEGDCKYEETIKPESIRFCFIYRDEFRTEVVAKNLEEAMKKLDNVPWKRTEYGLWNEYLEVECDPIIDKE